MLTKLVRYLPLLLVPIAIQLGLAQKTCSNTDLKGLYGFSATGRIFLPPNTPITGPFARAGYATIDGAGELLITSTASYNGLIFTEVFPGTYEVKPDCTFTYIASLGEPINFPVQFTGVIYDSGKRADFMLVNPPGSTINATIVRQDKVNCSSADMAGSYAFYSSGTVVAPAESAGPTVRIGNLTATANSSQSADQPGGSLKFSSTVSYAGAVQQEDFAGTYTVQKNCSLVMQMSADGGASTVKYDGMLVNDNKGVIFVLSALGTAVTGTLTLQ